jgi:hypothetical protein
MLKFKTEKENVNKNLNLLNMLGNNELILKKTGHPLFM